MQTIVAGSILAIMLSVGAQGILPNTAPSTTSESGRSISKFNGQQKTATSSQQDSEPSPIVTCTQCIDCCTIEQPHSKGKEEQAKEDSLNNLYRRYMGATIVGVMGAFVGLGLIFWQTIIARQSSKAAGDAAAAAKLNAQAVIDGDRAWLLMGKIDREYLVPVEIQHGRQNSVSFELKNFGKTVAKMTSWKYGLYITDVTDRPDPSAYDLAGIPFVACMVPPGEPWWQEVVLQSNNGFIRQAELAAINTHGTSFLWLCGIIKYEDVFRPGIEHETAFCYRYRTWIAGRDPFFGLAGPSEYNKAN